VGPFGVDACSRLESEPGLKDAEAVRRFVAAVRRFDER
jgi:phosphoribosylanthranilate isomerase